MAYSVDLAASEIIDLKLLLKKEKDGKVLRRYQCIWFAFEKYPKKEIAALLSINIDTVTDWIKLFNKNRLAGLGKLHYEGRRPSSLDAIKELMLNHIKTNSVSKLSELQHYIKVNHSIDVEHSWLSRYCKKNSVALTKRQD
jgi:transposase